MMASVRSSTSRCDWAVEDAVAIFTQRMANEDPLSPHTSIIEDVVAWMAEEGSAPPVARAGNIQYTFLGVAVGFWLLIHSSQPVSIANLWRVLVHELSPQQRALLGMTVDLSGTRAETIIAGHEKGASPQHIAAGKAAETKEYARLSKVVDAFFDTFDPSPFHKGPIVPRPQKQKSRKREKGWKQVEVEAVKHGIVRRRTIRITNALRDSIRDTLNHPDRRISPEIEARNHVRMIDIMNKVVSAVVDRIEAGTHEWDVMTDETLVFRHGIKYGCGTAPDKLTCADLDAGYWPGKHKDRRDGKDATKPDPSGEDDTGFGYGFTFILRMSRPYKHQVCHSVIGVYIDVPTGGRADAVRQALIRASRHGLLEGMSRRPRLIADLGFSAKNDWIDVLDEWNFEPVIEYQSNWHRTIVLADQDEKGATVNGAVIVNGCIRCPGIAGLDPERIPDRRTNDNEDETPEEIQERHAKVVWLDTLSMPVKEPLRPMKSPSGRPRKKGMRHSTGDAHRKWAITVQCPARLGIVNCDLVETPSGHRNPALADVPNPPKVADPSMLPRACRQDHVTYQLDLRTAKRIQRFTYASHAWEDAYAPARSQNEAYHSQWKHPSSGGVKNGHWIEMRGIAVTGFLGAIATAITTLAQQRAYDVTCAENDGPIYGPREHARRKRRDILKDVE